MSSSAKHPLPVGTVVLFGDELWTVKGIVYDCGVLQYYLESEDWGGRGTYCYHADAYPVEFTIIE